MDARTLPRPLVFEGDEEIPALSGEALLELHNAGRFAGVIARLVAQAKPSEIARVRAELLRRAADLMRGSQTSKVREIHAALVKFAARAELPKYLDAGTSDGLLCGVLMLDREHAPSPSTVTRALQGLALSPAGGV